MEGEEGRREMEREGGRRKGEEWNEGGEAGNERSRKGRGLGWREGGIGMARSTFDRRSRRHRFKSHCT